MLLIPEGMFFTLNNKDKAILCLEDIDRRKQDIVRCYMCNKELYVFVLQTYNVPLCGQCAVEYTKVSCSVLTQVASI